MSCMAQMPLSLSVLCVPVAVTFKENRGLQFSLLLGMKMVGWSINVQLYANLCMDPYLSRSV